MNSELLLEPCGAEGETEEPGNASPSKSWLASLDLPFAWDERRLLAKDCLCPFIALSSLKNIKRFKPLSPKTADLSIRHWLNQGFQKYITLFLKSKQRANAPRIRNPKASSSHNCVESACCCCAYEQHSEQRFAKDHCEGTKARNSC